MQLKLEQSLKTTISQQMQQSVAILQMDASQLEEYLAQESMANPLLEYRPAYGVYRPGMHHTSSSSEEAYLNMLNTRHHAKTLSDYLNEQIGTLHLSAQDRFLLQYLVLSLNPRGYLNETADDIARTLSIPRVDVQRCIGTLQSLDPIGVGTGNLSECLLLQLSSLPERNPAAEMLVKHIDQLAHCPISQLATALKIPLKELAAAKALVLSLNPCPSNGFASSEETRYICADLIVEQDAGGLRVFLNEAIEPQVSVDRDYSAHIRSMDSSVDTVSYLRQSMRRACFIIYCIRRRQATLLSCGEAIVVHQKAFFTEGFTALLPFTMSELAQMLNIHVSTVSRAIKHKTLSCDFGTIPLSVFFPRNALHKTEVSMTAVGIQHIIATLVKAEDKKKPLSDQSIMTYLAQKDIFISRRAVAKYRERLAIPSTAVRRIR